MLATIGSSGGPEQRQVVLRRADRQAGMVEVFTDSASAKVTEIRTEPWVSLLIWREEDQLQIRLRGSASVLDGAATRAEWQAMTEAQHGNYGTVPPPGRPIDESGGFIRVPDPSRLAILRITLDRIDAVHLARPQDLRAVYSRAGGWLGQWVAP